MDAARAFEPPDLTDAPFLAPIECVIDLPFPPTANKLWTARGGGMGQLRRSENYKRWKNLADKECVSNGSWHRRVPMPAKFTALILLDRAKNGGGDLDNRVKATLDWAQSRELVRNDRMCEEVTARWVTTTEAPAGCRLILRSVA